MLRGRKKNKGFHPPVVSEEARTRLDNLLQVFFDSNAQDYTFGPELTANERAYVHKYCGKMDMKSKSSGSGKNRRVRVYRLFRREAKSNGCNANDIIPSVMFSEGSAEVLGDLFVRYPPGDGGEDKERICEGSQKFQKALRMKDPMFCKPSMSQEDIAERVQRLASKMKNSKIMEDRSKLPMASYRDAVTSAVESNQVILIFGETGCGKTTQVPQYLLDHMWGKGETCKIVCTQPRRISAISVAERISYERGQEVGRDVGYKIRLESKGGRQSSVVFCTNGILLRILISRGVGMSIGDASNEETKQQDLSDITHIIVDEIHERDRYADFMLAILRDLLPSYPHLRLILMSATVDAERFSQYFGGCPVIRVPGFTYPVKTFYLEDVLSILRSIEHNHLDKPALGGSTSDYDLLEEDKLALDEAISMAWSDDDFDPLLELISTQGTCRSYDYQHSVTGLTPLMVFAGKGRVDYVCMLLSFGADCQLRAGDGTTALELAERLDQLESAQVLKDHMESALSNSIKQQNLLDKYLQYFNPENIDVILIEQLLRKICSDSKDGAILVFLPGWDDIRKTEDRLLMNPYFRDPSKCVIIPLHSSVPAAEQRKVFSRPRGGCRKIVLSTNIAETAVTIDDVVYVVNTGRMKEKDYDPFSNVSTLHSSWVSKASAKQRQGRAGRCQPGICYHLYPRLRAASLSDYQVPEIRRMPIEELCLQVKLLDPDCKIDEFLNKTLDPPQSETIRNAISVLQDIGALSVDEKLTELGEKLGSLPVHPLTSKMLFFAILMNCLDPALTLACAADYKDPFLLPMMPEERQKALDAKAELCSLYGGHSDQLAVIAAFNCWKLAKQQGKENRFCAKYFVSGSTMYMLAGMRNLLQTELIRLGFIPEDVSRCSLNAQNPGIINAVLVAGLYPMLGKMLISAKGGKIKGSFIEIPNGSKVRLHTRSIISKSEFRTCGGSPLVVFDEITRGDGGSSIRNCSLVGPLPLLLLSSEIAVAPANDDEESDVDDNDYGSDEDAMEIDCQSGGQREEKIMSSPDKSVMVIVDGWLYFQSKALDIAQIYCLRERLSTAILFKVTHPKEVLPPDLGESIYAIACVLSYDSLSGIPLQKSTDLPTSYREIMIGKSGKVVLRDNEDESAELKQSLGRSVCQKFLPQATDLPASNGAAKLSADQSIHSALPSADQSIHSAPPPLGSAPANTTPPSPSHVHVPVGKVKLKVKKKKASESKQLLGQSVCQKPLSQATDLPASNGAAKLSDNPSIIGVAPLPGSASTDTIPSSLSQVPAPVEKVKVKKNKAKKSKQPSGQSVPGDVVEIATDLPASNGAAKLSCDSSSIHITPPSALADTTPLPPSQVPAPAGLVEGKKRKKHRNQAG
ncbi:DExH-box ATP-dependent RNA helicase DExH6-like [Argentina anserina]|uniref:DExH-box ATP-dependent RNA helicase DExH6-like n=1 Tax=Argentina anserina TaxID=57926 RepID=UPI0021763C1C|nr:DExH-box ATP-dependent RNA helicase DExH6-like [Potentilla anserina]